MDKIRFGVIGAAGVIGKSHVEAVSSAGNALLTAVTDVAREAALKIAEEKKVRFFESYAEMIESDDLDAITICTPHPLHCEIAIGAMKARKHVLTEKPMAVSVSEADRMNKVARETGFKVGVVFQRRYEPASLKAKELIEGGEIGEIYRTGIINTAFKTQYYFNSGAWRGTWKGEGGGVLLNQAPHSIDLFQWLVGMPRKVVAWVRTTKHQIEVEDIATAIVEYENGAHGYMHFNTVQTPNQNRIEIFGEKAMLVIEDGSVKLEKLEMPLQRFIDTDTSHIYAKPKSERVEVELGPPKPGHVQVVEDFADSILSNRKPFVTGEEGIKSLEIANAIILSSYRNKAVELPLNRRAYDRLLEDLRSGKIESRSKPG